MTKDVTNASKRKALVTELLIRWLARPTELAITGDPKQIVDFHVLVSQGILIPANANDTARSNDWEDEIHPSAACYRKMAENFVNPVLRGGGLAGA